MAWDQRELPLVSDLLLETIELCSIPWQGIHPHGCADRYRIHRMPSPSPMSSYQHLLFAAQLYSTYENIVVAQLGKRDLDDAELFWLLIFCEAHQSNGLISSQDPQSRSGRSKPGWDGDVLSAFIWEGRFAEPILSY
jgi:hypothetical protein